MTFWVLANLTFVGLIETFSSLTGSDSANDGKVIVNDGKIGFLEVYALYLAALVLYKVFFGAIHIIKFKILYNCSKKYKIHKFEMLATVRKLRMQAEDWSESEQDEAIMLDQSNNLITKSHFDKDDDEDEFLDAKAEE